MKILRRAQAAWYDTVEDGSGEITVGSEAFQASYSLRSRVGDERNTSPEELIGAANAACFAMSLSNLIENEGHTPNSVVASARVTLEEEKGGRFSITGIILEAVGDVPGIDESTFQTLAEEAKKTCPVSRALAGTTIELRAHLAASKDRA